MSAELGFGTDTNGIKDRRGIPIIISDRHKFVFVHIPKCAGTTVRTLLEQFDETDGAYAPSIRKHPTLGRVDYTHLPLKLLREIAPEDFGKVRTYRAFALVRDPEARFVSALSQRLKMYGTHELAQIDTAEADRLAGEVVERLQDPSAAHLPEFIHFARQSDFISCDGEELIEDLYPTTHVSHLVREIGRITGEDMGRVGNDNPTLVFRNDGLRRLALGGKAISQGLLGTQATTTLRGWARRLLMTPLQDGGRHFPLGDEVRAFVRTFYAEDFRLYARVSQAMQSDR